MECARQLPKKLGRSVQVFADQAASPDLEEAGIDSQWQSINYGEAFFDSIDPMRTFCGD